MIEHPAYSQLKESRFNTSNHFKEAVLFLAAISCMAGCSPLTTIGELPPLSKIENQITHISLSPRLKLGEFDEKRFTECMLPLSANIKPGLIEMAAQAKNINGELSYDLMNRLSDLDGFALSDDFSLLGRLLEHLPIAIKLPDSKTHVSTASLR